MDPREFETEKLYDQYPEECYNVKPICSCGCYTSMTVKNHLGEDIEICPNCGEVLS